MSLPGSAESAAAFSAAAAAPVAVASAEFSSSVRTSVCALSSVCPSSVSSSSGVSSPTTAAGAALFHHVSARIIVSIRTAMPKRTGARHTAKSKDSGLLCACFSSSGTCSQYCVSIQKT